MEIRLWGVRGSIPAPGPDTLEFGGNTTCVEVVLASGRRVVIDGGSGFRLLGEHLKREGTPAKLHLLLTHGHADHLLGVPFFSPIYLADTEIQVDGWPPAFHALTHIFNSHMEDAFFPVAFDELQARISFLDRIKQAPLDLDGARLESIRLNHPQGGLGYRIKEGDHTLVFITDNELGAGQWGRLSDFVRFAQGCDLLIHDAQYLPEEMAEHRGWGHSSYQEAVTLALEAGVRRLLLTHHDPTRTDAQVHEILEQSRQLAASRAHPPQIDAAREGAVYSL
jgi:phosphoribosyl 1,2-cyclic phosphodiesterase